MDKKASLSWSACAFSTDVAIKMIEYWKRGCILEPEAMTLHLSNSENLLCSASVFFMYKMNILKYLVHSVLLKDI